MKHLNACRHNSTHKLSAILLGLCAFALPTFAENYVSYTGEYTEIEHPTIEGAHVVTLTTSGTLKVAEDMKLMRLLVVGGGGGGGSGGGAGGQAIDWTPEALAVLKHDDAYTAHIGYGGFRSNNGSPKCRGHNGDPSSFVSSSINIVVQGGGGGRAYDDADGRWNPESPDTYGNGGGGATDINDLSGFEAGAEGCYNGGAATSYSSGPVGCGGGGGGAGAAGNGGDSQILNITDNNDPTPEYAGAGGPGLVSDITGEAISYGDGGGGGVRRSNYKFGGVGGLGGGGRGCGVYNGSFANGTDAATNRGGGGGGGGWNAGGTEYKSGHGANGVVIVLVAPLAEGEEANDRYSVFADGGHAYSWEDDEANCQNIVHEFRGSGTLEISRGIKVDLLLVGGGGAGGEGSGGGGGAGGLIHKESIMLPRGTYTVTVGDGGVNDGENGGDTSLVCEANNFSLVAFGGGAGGGYVGGKTRYPGSDGGSGGGATTQQAGGQPLIDADGNTQGFPGGNAATYGYTPGGGGGAGSAGTDATTGSAITCIGDGGEGLAFDISGELRYYAAGGGGGFSSSTETIGFKGTGGSGIGGDGECFYTNFRRMIGHHGLDGTGSGGGGGGRGGGKSGKGGTGILIVRYSIFSQPTSIIIH